jgi:peptidoglycan/LPS O-acetylase OafA/YrhL
MFFYAVCPALIAVFWVAGMTTPRRAGIVAILASVAWFFVSRHHVAHPDYHWWCYVFPVTRLFDFTVGLALGFAYLGLPEGRRTRHRWATGTLLEIAAVGALVVALWLSPRVPYPIRLGAYYTPFMALIVFVFALGHGALSAALRWRPLLVCGEASYAFYLFHVHAIRYFISFKSQLGLGELGPRTSAWVIFFFTLTLSILLHYAYERPTRWLIRRALVRRPKRAPAAAPARIEPPRRLAA